ncbi:DUF952 domain-containing protein [Actinomyces capricornis]|uniref:DUF952 domain-containing protein n=1 Tax=Actinomyces capricornis TaxID=2755559 RepID=A0ABN6K2J9_9ACTO|nr:DUF952 domain-containing protein [Actinomyces capricornis]BDA63835.1 hypothetical protein MANAM107_06690 [Actinomyces capricornis]
MILHIALAEDWARAQRRGTYPWSTRGVLASQQGFVHGCATIEQVGAVMEAVYPDRPDVVLLQVDEAALAGHGLEVREEPGDPSDPDSELFPHIYGGPLPTRLLRPSPLPLAPGEPQ